MCSVRRYFISLAKMSSSALQSIREVDIDPEGTFKYVLIKVYGEGKETDPAKVIVRGYKRCPYHTDKPPHFEFPGFLLEAKSEKFRII